MQFSCPILDRSTNVEETGFGRDSWSLVRCRETGFVFLANPPEYSQLESDLAFDKTFFLERNRRKQEEPVVFRVSSGAKTARRKLFPKRNKMAALGLGALREMKRSESLGVLDVGCGTGGLLLEFNARCETENLPIEMFGIEVSPYLVARARKKVSPCGGTIIQANAIEGLAGLQPHNIHLALMSSFLEHECRPLELLKRLYPLLTADGAIVLKVPNFACWNRMIRGRRWCGFRYPDHVNYFTPKTLRTLATEAGFTVARQTVLDKFPLSDNMYAILRKRS